MHREQKEVLTFLLRHLISGLAGAFAFGIGLLWFDIAQLRTLAFNSSNPVLVIGLLFFGLCVTFGSAAMGFGIMSLGKDDPP